MYDVKKGLIRISLAQAGPLTAHKNICCFSRLKLVKNKSDRELPTYNV